METYKATLSKVSYNNQSYEFEPNKSSGKQRTIIAVSIRKYINTQIVCMRHNVRRARVQTVNKLSRVVKGLRTKKGTEDQKKQNIKKADRLAEEILLLKKLKDDEISRFCLENTRDSQEILADVTEDLETKALARISRHKSLSPLTVKFRLKYPDWKEALKRIYNNDKALPKKPKPEKKKNIKFEKKSVPPAINKLEGDFKLVESNHSEGSIISSSGSDEALDEDDCHSAEEEVSETESGDNRSGREIVDSAQKSLSIPISEKMETFESVELVPENNNNSNDVEMDAENESETDSTSFDTNLDNKTDIMPRLIPCKVNKYVDPFFVTNDNKEYLSYAEVDNDSVENLPEERNYDDDGFRPKKIMNERSSWENRKYFSKVKDSSGFQGKRKTFKDTTSRKNPVGYPQVTKRVPDINPDIKLHPSWEAKKKQSTAITSFQGKKISFDD